MNRFDDFAYRASFRHTKTVWVLKCDVKKFFASVDHRILFEILEKYIPDKDIMWLIWEIVGSFHSTKEEVGLPLGNLTSQLFVNIYMNELDQFLKHKLKAKWYIRYADDFVILYQDRKWLESILVGIKMFLKERLRLTLHPDKINLTTFASGVDFLGWVHFPDYRVLRNIEVKAQMADAEKYEATIQSYCGILEHGDAHELHTLITDRTASSRSPCPMR